MTEDDSGENSYYSCVLVTIGEGASPDVPPSFSPVANNLSLILPSIVCRRHFSLALLLYVHSDPARIHLSFPSLLAPPIGSPLRACPFSTAALTLTCLRNVPRKSVKHQEHGIGKVPL